MLGMKKRKRFKEYVTLEIIEREREIVRREKRRVLKNRIR